MPVDLFIENVPDVVVQRLKERAKRHQRSVQSEALAIIEEAVGDYRRDTPISVLAEVRQLGLQTPNEATHQIRMDRNRT